MRKSISFLSLLLISSCSLKNPYDVKFDSDEWKNNTGIVRHRMFKDLDEQFLKIGLSTAELKQLLGKPESHEGDTWTYIMTGTIPEGLQPTHDEFKIEIEFKEDTIREIQTSDP